MADSVRAGALRAEDAFDVEAVHRWLVGRVPGLSGTPEVRQFGGGASNLTYLLAYPGRDLVLRRPPHGTKAASAHDMGREVTVQRGLAPLWPLVPQVHAFCEDRSVIGAEFYVMERLEGTILGAELPPGLTLDAPQARVLGHAVIDTLADLHSVDVERAGLARLGKGPGYVARQVEGWSGRWRAAVTDDAPDAEPVMTWLYERQPVDVAARMLHGDWKLDNLVVALDDPGGAPRIVGVLDWEMATVGDPLMDLGASMAYWITSDDDPLYGLLRRQPTHLPGMPTRAQMVARYLERTGLPMGDWRFYEVFGLFRLAVIIQQIWARYRAGQTTNPAFRHFGGAVAILVERATGRLAGPP
ncbi:phosphotransferase family protein [Thermomonospora umbrina]|uniref:Aminoglycoside phosphotransferase (APT) family kinase protein n=1 Tax=Thermomonospora umbrina TaxID=111806 RepID=A0A3D9SNC4_9ACTN|nr:phosphotransferase family protein [Thermomonospora umbrina]REE95930.1 aminoglycoside phosphotransferase (APT) family kinase protein [Thermomonospora umbrina]